MTYHEKFKSSYNTKQELFMRVSIFVKRCDICYEREEKH